MPIHKSNGLTYLTFDLFDNYQIKHGVFMRHGGVSPSPWQSLNMATSVGDSKENVIENRTRVARAMNNNENTFFDVWQIHSNHVIAADKPRLPGQPHSKADAIITNKKKINLLMLFADCVPIFLFDINKRVAALVHAGWQGTAERIITAAINKMCKQYNCLPKNIIAGIGPAISVDHYEIGNELLGFFNESAIEIGKVIKRKNSSLFLDLKTANIMLMKQAGIIHIENINICTASHTEDWFSHRAENKKTGRFAAMISID